MTDRRDKSGPWNAGKYASWMNEDKERGLSRMPYGFEEVVSLHRVKSITVGAIENMMKVRNC